MRRERKLETKTVYIPLWGNRIIRLEKWLSEQAARGWIVEKIDLRGFHFVKRKPRDKDVYVLQKCREGIRSEIFTIQSPGELGARLRHPLWLRIQ